MKHVEDPKKTIFDKVGDLSGIQIFGNNVLIGIYERPKITKSGIHLADQTIREDEYQGKAGCVLLKGPAAFKSDDKYDFYGMDVQIGDWIAIFVSDGRKLVVNGQLCRLVEDQFVRLKLDRPDTVF